MTNSFDFGTLYEFALDKLKRDLAPDLSYHNLEHILDVYKYVDVIGKSENVSDEELILLKTAALFHDIGFVDRYENHEMRSCEIAFELLPQFGFTNEQINIISGQIMATKIPQSPTTPMEKILCDADLDYLGRDDYYLIAGQLYDELKVRNRVKDEKEWINIQIGFLENHNYWTQYGMENREPNKQIRLKELKKKH